jgi:hypothetical protein
VVVRFAAALRREVVFFARAPVRPDAFFVARRRREDDLRVEDVEGARAISEGARLSVICELTVS